MAGSRADTPAHRGLRGWLDKHDPTLYAVHRGLRAAIAVSIALPLSLFLVGNPQFTLFAAFGSLALIVFVDFPGNRQLRAFSYVTLGFVGMVLIALATLMSTTSWLAVLGMAVIGSAILFAGVLSAATAAASRALLLAYVLPVTVPVPAAELWARLGGWGLGMVIAIPLALFLWPPREHDDLRTGVSRACRELARSLADFGHPVAGDTPAAKAMGDLRRNFRASVSRPIGLSAGERLLARVVLDLDWLFVELRGAAGAGSHGDRWRQLVPDVTAASAAVLEAASSAMDRPTAGTRGQLTSRLQTLASVRRAALDHWVGEALAGRPPGDMSAAESIHSSAYATNLAGTHVSAALAADARSPLDKILGRGSELVVSVSLAGSTRLARHHLSWRSVWLHNSLRGGFGLALAVLLAQVTEVSHAFWVVLGTMSVLRSSVLNTGASVFRALLGTVIGVLVGAGLLVLIGDSPLLWVLLPLVMFLAGSASDLISFAAGQAAFSLAVLILFNLLSPGGWEVGLVRLQDVGIGAIVALIVALLLWPRGAAGAIRRAMADAYRSNARLMINAVSRLTAKPVPEASDRDAAIGAAFRLDDALRQYLADRGAKSVRIDDVIAVCVGSERIRLTAEALDDLANRSSGSVRNPSAPELEGDLRDRSVRQGHWLDAVAQELSDEPANVPEPPLADAVAGLVSAAQREPAEQVALQGSRVDVSIALHLDDLARHERKVSPHIAALVARPGRTQVAAAASV